MIEAAYLSICANDDLLPDESSRVDLVHLSKKTKIESKVKESLSRLRWKIFEHSLPFHDLEPRSTVLVLDGISSPVLADIQGRDDQWHGIHHLVNLDCKMLWVTSGSSSKSKIPTGPSYMGSPA